MTADARSTQRVEGGRISGDMLWFNNEKGHGFIETSTGDRLRVEASDFRNGPPEGRCAGLGVTFRGRGRFGAS
jgi:cold shock CspA family protein